MKPALLIDFSGTLCNDHFFQILGPEYQARVDDFLFGNKNEFIDKWMMGGYRTEKVCELLAKKLNLECQNLRDMFQTDCCRFQIKKDDLVKIDNLKKYYSTALVTINTDSFDRFTAPALGLERYFDVIVNSYNEKLFKHGEHKGLFDVALARLGVEYSGSVLIDDSENACKEFESNGDRALKVEGERNLSYWLDYLAEKYEINQ